MSGATAVSFTATARHSVLCCSPKTWLVLRRSNLPALSDQAIYGQWSRTTQNKGCETGEIQEVNFIARRAELRAGRGHRVELDRTESVGQMHSEHGYQKHRSHR